MRTDSIARRRPDPLPWTWEIPLLLVVLGAALMMIAALAGQGVAGLLTGTGWVWPDSRQLMPMVGALLSGHPRVAPAWLVYLSVAVVEAGLLLGYASALRWVWTELGPGRRAGLATRAQAAAVLGVGRLQRVRHLIRPDLYSRPNPRRLGRGGPRQRARRRSDPQSDSAGLTVRGRLGRAAVTARFDPAAVGWPLGRGAVPRTRGLWVPFDRTTGVYGPQGCGKTLDVLTPALLSAPGAALVTLTKPEDLLLTLTRRSRRGRPVAVLDPFGLAPGLPQLVWDPIGGCVDSMIAERRAKAFAAGTVAGAASSSGDNAARFYAAEAAKVLQGYFHAAALTGRSIADVLDWVANPRQASLPEEVLRTHPHAAPFWHGLLHAALHGDERTAGNTITTIQQALALFFQQSLRDRCVPGPGRAPVDVAELITRGGTVYLLGRDDPYASASPLMTAVAEDVLDTALQLAHASPHGRLCPSFLACLDELPSTAPLPTLRTRMANERALGLSFIYAAQTWRQLVICYGQDEARALFGLTNIITLFGGGKDGAFNREMSELIGTTRVTRTTHTHGAARMSTGTSHTGADEPILRPEEIRLLPERHALIVAENAKPLIVRLTRAIDGKPGQALLAAHAAAKAKVDAARDQHTPMGIRTRAAVDAATRLDLTPPPRAWTSPPSDPPSRPGDPTPPLATGTPPPRPQQPRFDRHPTGTWAGEGTPLW